VGGRSAPARPWHLSARGGEGIHLTTCAPSERRQARPGRCHPVDTRGMGTGRCGTLQPFNGAARPEVRCRGDGRRGRADRRRAREGNVRQVYGLRPDRGGEFPSITRRPDATVASQPRGASRLAGEASPSTGSATSSACGPARAATAKAPSTGCACSPRSRTAAYAMYSSSSATASRGLLGSVNTMWDRAIVPTGVIHLPASKTGPNWSRISN
jgi:hypothetical protein